VVVVGERAYTVVGRVYTIKYEDDEMIIVNRDGLELHMLLKLGREKEESKREKGERGCCC